MFSFPQTDRPIDTDRSKCLKKVKKYWRESNSPIHYLLSFLVFLKSLQRLTSNEKSLQTQTLYFSNIVVEGARKIKPPGDWAPRWLFTTKKKKLIKNRLWTDLAYNIKISMTVSDSLINSFFSFSWLLNIHALLCGPLCILRPFTLN